MQSLCTLRNHCRQWPRNTRYQAGRYPLLDPKFTRLNSTHFYWPNDRYCLTFHRTPPAQNRTCGFPAYGSHLGCVTANCRMRSSACDTLIRFCARHVLCWPAFPLVPALRSTVSAALAPVDASAVGCSALFAGFSSTLARSYLSCPFIIGYGSSPSRCGPPYLAHTRQRRPDRRYPRVRYDPFARDVALGPGRASAPRLAMPRMLPSRE